MALAKLPTPKASMSAMSSFLRGQPEDSTASSGAPITTPSA